MWLGVELAGVDDREDFDGARNNAIDQDVVGMDDRLSRAGDAARAMEFRMLGQAIRRVLECRIQAQRRRLVARGDIVENLKQACFGRRVPDDRQRHLCRSRIAWTFAITSACGMRGAVEASAFSTLARTHASCASSSSVEANSETMGESFAMRGI